jgi:hypothetical protein
VHLLPEDTWGLAAAAGSVALGIALFVRRFAATRRLRIGATIAVSVAASMLALGALAAAVARDDRLHFREGVIVSSSARPSDNRGVARPGAPPLPEAARVRIVESKPGWTRVRWGGLDAWLPSPSVRPIAHPEV